MLLFASLLDELRRGFCFFGFAYRLGVVDYFIGTSCLCVLLHICARELSFYSPNDFPPQCLRCQICET